MKRLLIVIFFVISSLFIVARVNAQTTPLPEQFTPQEYYEKATVIQVISETTKTVDGIATIYQKLRVHVLDGKDAGKSIVLERGNDAHLAAFEKVNNGTTVILDVVLQPNQPIQYTITDTYRIPSLIYLGLGFFAFILFVTGKKGFGAIVGLCISLLVIMGIMIPLILNHQSPLLASIVCACIILLATTFLAHGFSKQTAIAVISTFFALMATVIFSIIAVHIATLAGLGTEDSYLLELNPNQSIDPQGLLLAGIIIGALGALNDITTTQVASIFALKKTNPAADFLHLTEQGFSIGREHIISLINTLVLAYAGSSLVVFIFFALNPSHLPWWVIINNESVAQEIVRAIAGSFGLVLAIPITTVLAAWWVNKKSLNKTI